MNIAPFGWPLLGSIVFPLLAALGLFRVVEVAALWLLPMLGQDDPQIATAIALAVVAILVLLVAGLFWRINRQSGIEYTYTPPEGDAPSPDELREREALARLMERADDTSPLRRVLAIGDTINAGEASVELIALELRDSVGRLHVVVRDPEGAELEKQFHVRLMKGGSPSSEDFPSQLRPVIHLADELGTTYAVWSPGGGGSAGNYRYEVLFGPPIPAAAQTIAIVVERLTDEPVFRFPGRQSLSRIIDGPWRVEVPL